MASRRDIGNRQLPKPVVAKSAVARYLIAHACFNCRKSFKVAPRDERIAVCPNCSGQLHEMGRSFKSPAAKDTEQWAKVEALYNAGFRFFSYRSFDCPPLPGKLSEVETFIRDNPKHPMLVAAPNYAIKGTSVETLDSSELSSGASVPYFGC